MPRNQKLTKVIAGRTITGNEMPLPVRYVDASLLWFPVRLLTDASGEERVGKEGVPSP